MKNIFGFLLLSALLSTAAPAFAHDPADAGGDVEKRITELHTKLKITTTQEDQWKAVTQEMRDSAGAMKDLATKRESDSGTMSAIDDLKSYSAIADLHADRMKKFIDVFTPLYNSMTDDQKKNADEIFRGHKEAKRKKAGKS